jgi:hypothetical protein
MEGLAIATTGGCGAAAPTSSATSVPGPGLPMLTLLALCTIALAWRRWPQA